MSGVDTIVMARTGSGKTCAFLWPLLEKVTKSDGIAAVILSPTRELSLQTLSVLKKLLKAMQSSLTAVGIHGSESMEKQFGLLASSPDILVATPGRLAHLLQEIPDLNLAKCTTCILDEADRLLEMGFGQQLTAIVRGLPEAVQHVLLSATLPKQLVEFTKLLGSSLRPLPTMVRLDNEVQVSAELRQAFFLVRSAEKDAALLQLLNDFCTKTKSDDSQKKSLTLVFVATRHHVEYICTLIRAAGHDCTYIYGTLDQQARQAHLSAFRNGATPILVVTDVAARGIDVPLIDHVIHYHFPASPKLFVHRSGRAARAGRIGYAWGLVDPEELPYLWEWAIFSGKSIETDDTAYSLTKMQADQVHYGSIPDRYLTAAVEGVQHLLHTEMTASQDAQTMRVLTKVCRNAMKQYRKTRPEASSVAVRKAKAILEGERDSSTGRREPGATMVSTHPLYLKRDDMNEERQQRENEREDFLRAVSSFRPKETVFEAFGTGSAKNESVVSHLDKGRTTKQKQDKTTSGALQAMKDMRRQMRLVRDKGAMIVAGSEALEEGEEPTAENEVETLDASKEDTKTLTVGQPVQNKRRLSKAERKRLKKGEAVQPPTNSLSSTKKTKKTDFKDPMYYMSNDFDGNTEAAARERSMEAALQPSAASGRYAAAKRLEEAMLDVVGDENEQLVQKQRLMRWDKSKRKYVATTVGAELSGDSASKKMRLESGQLVKSSEAKLGEIYAKWQRKTKRSVGRQGVFDDGDNETSAPLKREKGKGKRGGKSELKSTDDIVKSREKAKNLKMKNMKKSDRRLIEQKQRDGKRANTKKQINKAVPKKRR